MTESDTVESEVVESETVGPENDDSAPQAGDSGPETGESGPQAGDSGPETGESEPVDPDRHLSGEVEALLLMAEEPMAASTLAQALEVPTHEVEETLAALVRFYDETERGFELRHLGGGWRYYTRARHAEVITRHVLDGQQSRLSQAALETLAVVAYQQPISRSRISAVRGVNVDGVIRTLVARGLIDEAGTDAETGAIVFATTDHFLERIGVTSLDELPDLAPHLPEVDELEAELGELARVAADEPEAAPDESGPEEGAPEGGAPGEATPEGSGPQAPDQEADPTDSAPVADPADRDGFASSPDTDEVHDD